MLNGDALLSFLSQEGHGSWSTFERAIEDVTGRQFQAYASARACSSHALVEFDWIGKRSWSIPPLTLVQVDAERYIAVGVLDESMETNLLQLGITIKQSVNILTERLSYTRRELVDAGRRGLVAFEKLGDQLRFEPSTIFASRALLAALPQIGSIIDSRRPISLNAAIGSDAVTFLDVSRLSFSSVSTMPDYQRPFEMIRGKRLYRQPEYYYVDVHGARPVELEIALTYAAARSGVTFIRNSEDMLAIRNSVPLPILFARALHLSGARYFGARIAKSDGLKYDVFSGIAESTARTLAMKLLTRISLIQDGDFT